MSIKPFTGNSISFITTNNCTAACPHCVMCCKPGLKRALTFEQMRDTIDSMRKREKLELVVFTGGEPTLLREDLLKGIKYCSGLGILTRIVTNCYWATTPENAKKVLSVLREVGLDELNFSMDDYHAPYVPIENIRNAWKASKGMGFEAVVIANSHGENDKILPDYIQEYFGETIQVRDPDHRNGTQNEKRDEDGALYIITEARLQKTGRAGDEIPDENFMQVQNQDYFNVGCKLLVTQPSVSFSNHMWACCGIQSDDNEVLNLGDLNTEDAGDILERAGNSVLINAIHYLGPLFLTRFVSSKNPDIVFEENYHSVCEICQRLTMNHEAVAELKKHYGELTAYIIAAEEQEEQKKNAKSNGTDKK